MQIIFKKKKYDGIEKTFYIDEGSTIIENYNETLDSANIRISHIAEHLDIEPFDRVILRDEEGRLNDRYMCIDTYTETMESLDPITYSYEISLFSETKELENYVLPNLSITQLSNGTHRSVLYYLQQYLDLYGPKIRVNGSFVSKFTYSLGNTFDIDCPEMQWNNPTLREVITDLMMVVDCIPVKRNNVISFMNLTEKKNPIDTTKVNYIQRSQSSEDYVSELRMDMLNVMQTSIDGVKNTCETTEYLTFKAADDGYVVTDNNMILKTQFPILRINHLWMMMEVAIDEDKFSRTFDLCNLKTSGDLIKNLVYEYEEFSVLPQRRYEPTDFSEINQNVALYFNRGSNIITGFTKESKRRWWGYGSTNTTLTIIKNLICKDRQYNNIVSGENVYYSTFFKIEYETTVDSVFQAGKLLPTTHERIITDNQTNAYVDAYNQGFMEYQKANRLGNQQLHINARYENDYSNILKIGDYYEDSIVFQTQYQIYKNHIEVNASATKDYILRDYFTGVKARIRSWKIADASQALSRHDLKKDYLEFSFNEKHEYISQSIGIDVYDFMSPFENYTVEPIRYCVLYTVDYSNVEYPAGPGERYSVNTIGRIIGNSIVFEFGFEDNLLLDKNVIHTLNINNVVNTSYPPIQGGGGYNLLPFRLHHDFTDDYGGVPLEPTRYADDNGEFAIISYNFLTTINQEANVKDMENWTNLQEKNFMVDICRRPLINMSNDGSSYTMHNDMTIHKDNREIFKLSTQYEFCSDTNDIMFTKYFLEYQKCIRNKITMLTGQTTYSPENWTLDTDTGYYFSNEVVIDEKIANGTLVNQEITGGTIEDVMIFPTLYNDRVVIGVVVQTEDISNVSVTLTFAYNYEDPNQEKTDTIAIYRLPSDRYDFKNANPDLTDATYIGNESRLFITQVNDYICGLYIDVPEIAVNNSTYYIYCGGKLILAMNQHNRCYLNLLRSRDCNIYDENGEPIDTI